MRAAENSAFAKGISAEALMNTAGAGIARGVQQFFPQPGHCLCFAGKGNNGGDALVAAAHLKRAGWHTDVHLSFSENESSDLLRKKIAEFRDTAAIERILNVSPSFIVLDGLLGFGSEPPLLCPILAACREINRLRREEGAYVFAVDLPSGLDGDTGAVDQDCIFADFTVTIGAAKRGLLADDALNFIGRLAVVSLPELGLPDTEETITCPASLQEVMRRRQFNAFKNQFGRIGVVAGTIGFAGAANRCAFGALRDGAGVVEVFVPENIYDIVAAAAPFESMVKPIKTYAKLRYEAGYAWAIGPGLGRDNAPEIIELIQRAENPMVVDA